MVTYTKLGWQTYEFDLMNILRSLAEINRSLRKSFIRLEDIRTEFPPSAAQFPLDRYLRSKFNGMMSAGEGFQAARNGNFKKKIDELAMETEKIAQGLDFGEISKESVKSDSTTLNESGSSFTQQLVESKFKEVTFRQKMRGGEKAPKERRNSHTFFPDMFGDKVRRKASPPQPYNQAEEDLNSNRPEHQNRKPTLRHTLQDHMDSITPKSTPRELAKTKSCKCGKKALQSKCRRAEAPSGESAHSHSTNSTKHSHLLRSKTFVISSDRKRYQDVSVNTEHPRFRNTSLVNITSGKEISDLHNPFKFYQVQELPKVNIRPNLTKQVGPVIDIKMSKAVMKKDNIAVLEYIHPEVLQENKMPRNISQSVKPIPSLRNASSSTTDLTKSTKELKLQRSLKELLKKLNEQNPHVTRLKNAINSLIRLLNKVVPFHTASILYQNENISLVDESIDLFFTNVDIVQEVIENELKNPPDKFCQHPEYIMKAVNLLCGNIRSIFDVSESQPSPLLSKINNFIEQQKSPKKSKVRDKKAALTSPRCPAAQRLTVSERKESSAVEKEIGSPKELYIPFKKLTPGGLFQQLEEAESQSEIELRRKRLEKIQEINSNLKSLESRLLSDVPPEGTRLKPPEDIQDLMNRTFIIESENEDIAIEEDSEGVPPPKREEEEAPTKREEETSKKSDEYEEDWEQDMDTKDSSSGCGSLQMTHLTVEAEVHPERDIERAENVKHQDAATSERPSPAQHEIGNGFQNTYISKAIQTEIDEIRKIYSDEPANSQPITREQISCPVLRMTNPNTNALLEVRFPELNDKFQSSLHFQKTESNEEIKLSYNTHLNKSPVADISTKIKNGEATKNENERTVSSNNNEKKICTSELENITSDFIGFLENKVTEMVKKFKNSETSREKLITEKKSSLHKAGSSFNSGLKSGVPMYKSASSLFSDKSVEELKFSKMTVSRGCSPDVGRFTFENLVSPPVTLQVKTDSLAQTDDVERCKEHTDACVGTSGTGLNHISPEDSKFKSTQTDEHPIGLSNNQALQWPSPILDDLGLNISRSRLLPLPEDVLSPVNSESRVTINSTVVHRSQTETVRPRETPRNSNYESENLTCDENTLTKRQFQKDLLREIVQNVTKFTEKTDFKVSSSADDGGDSQRTSQFLNSELINEEAKNLQINFHSFSQEIPLNNYSSPKKSLSSTEIFHSNKRRNIQKLFPQPTVDSEGGGDTSSKCNPIETKENALSLFITGDAAIGFESNSKNIEILKELSSTDTNKIEDSSSRALTEDLPVAEDISEVKINECPETFLPNRTYEIENLADTKDEISNELVNLNVDVPDMPEDPDEDLVMEERRDFRFSLQDDVHSLVEKKEDLKNTDNSGESLPLAEVSFRSQSSSELSQEHLTIYYYDSEDMSEGEIGFVYTSNSYSSGEIKPIQVNKNHCGVANEYDDTSECDSKKNDLLSPDSEVKEAHENVVENNEEEERNNVGDGLNVALLETCSGTSISTGELQRLMDLDERLDEATLRSLVDNNFLYSSEVSPDSQAELQP